VHWCKQPYMWFSICCVWRHPSSRQNGGVVFAQHHCICAPQHSRLLCNRHSTESRSIEPNRIAPPSASDSLLVRSPLGAVRPCSRAHGLRPRLRARTTSTTLTRSWCRKDSGTELRKTFVNLICPRFESNRARVVPGTSIHLHRVVFSCHML
jgi:hypothetical protein